MNYNDDFREKLNLDDLYSNKKEEFQGKIKVYQNLLARVHRKIKHTSRQRNNDCYCFYVIPEFIFGIPKMYIVTFIYYSKTTRKWIFLAIRILIYYLLKGNIIYLIMKDEE